MNPLQDQTDWLQHINRTLAAGAKGHLATKDNRGNPVLLEWESVDPVSPRLNEKIKEVRDILVETYTQIELQFTQQCPESVPNEFFLKSLAPLFQAGTAKVDWILIEDKIRAIFQTFFASTDFTKFSKEHEVLLFVVARNKNNGLPQGIIQFLMNKDFPYGTVKACYFGILPTLENLGLEKILMASIFKILPEANRIILHTRASNTKVIEAYLTWGFQQFNESIPNWPDFEYLKENSKELLTSF